VATLNARAYLHAAGSRCAPGCSMYSPIFRQRPRFAGIKRCSSSHPQPPPPPPPPHSCPANENSDRPVKFRMETMPSFKEKAATWPSIANTAGSGQRSARIKIFNRVLLHAPFTPVSQALRRYSTFKRRSLNTQCTHGEPEKRITHSASRGPARRILGLRALPRFLDPMLTH